MGHGENSHREELHSFELKNLVNRPPYLRPCPDYQKMIPARVYLLRYTPAGTRLETKKESFDTRSGIPDRKYLNLFPIGYTRWGIPQRVSVLVL